MSDESVAFVERWRAAPRRQQGLSLISLIFLGLIAIVLLTIGFKLVPSLIEYLAIDRAVQKIKNEGATVREIRSAFDRYATIDDITKDADGVVISYAYSYSVSLADNVRLVIDYSGSTRDRRGKAP
jgi:predicted PurR-regulated permease PerM